MFKLWSKDNPQVKKFLKPDLGTRSWNEIPEGDKRIIWLHFINKGWFRADEDTYKAVNSFNEANKACAFCNHLLNHGGPHYMEMRGIRHYMEKCCQEAAQLDFQHIFHNEVQDVVYELISYYVFALESDGLDEKKKSRFRNLFNDISNQFGLNIMMIQNSFVPRQDKKITKEIYEPVLNYLSDEKWKEVNNLLADAFDEYKKNTPQGYSNCVTNIMASLQAFLQIVVNRRTGKGDICKLILEAQKKGLIPNDFFTKQIFSNIESIFARERQETSTAHPKQQYANEKNTRTMLNLAMIFFQHCIQK